MTPYLIDIMLHYYTCPGPHPDPNTGRGVQDLLDRGFLNLDEFCDAIEDEDRITEKGHAYLEALFAVPEPVEHWLIPDLDRRIDAEREQQRPRWGGIPQRQDGLTVEVSNTLKDRKYDIKSDQQYGVDKAAEADAIADSKSRGW
jgi:hypothetical protein